MPDALLGLLSFLVYIYPYALYPSFPSHIIPFLQVVAILVVQEMGPSHHREKIQSSVKIQACLLAPHLLRYILYPQFLLLSRFTPLLGSRLPTNCKVILTRGTSTTNAPM